MEFKSISTVNKKCYNFTQLYGKRKFIAMEIYLAHTQGFCAGVSRAITIVDQALKKYGPPLFVYHEIVHNKSVVSDFKSKGVTFVDTLEGVPQGARLIFSAHGVSPSVIKEAQKKNIQFIDATCPLVGRIHRRAEEFSKKGTHVVLIGHRKHEEVVGTQGYVANDLLHVVEKEKDIESLSLPTDTPVGFVTQTTLSKDDTQSIVEALHKKYPALIMPVASDICYATQNRQDAVKELCKACDIIIICGSPNSSNSQRLRETAQKHNVESILIDKADELNIALLDHVRRVGISSGASVPEYIVAGVIEKITRCCQVSKVHRSESPEKELTFSLPKI